MFSNFFLKSFRILLLPFALLYWLGLVIRNWLYDRRIVRSTVFGLPVICIGNLSVGGTGKSPLVEYLLRVLKDRYRVATLSRGYKRKTRGYALAGDQSTALDIGDEPMQFHLKYPDVPVAVGEERLVAIPLLLHDRPDTQAILLDDAFQHRAVRAGLNILLTDYGNLFTRDFYLPTGDLRDLKSRYRQAQILVVTKCPADLASQEAEIIRREIRPVAGQDLFFATLKYEPPYHIISRAACPWHPGTEVLLVTGIANPKPLQRVLESQTSTYTMLHYPDHHIFTIDDLNEIRRQFQAISAADKILLTTEKDAVRLLKFRPLIEGLPLYVLPVQHQFLFGQEEAFSRIVIKFIENFNREEQNY
ncbi:MAG TPA: tetraacyldisaccharide 4'-kinase [Chitinophagaceae bacterium]|nr:tetraacyldisaccharide 4'-kinase [Chitinophagaceae bacterium]